MNATTVMLLAFAILIVTHWANKKPTINAKTIVEMAFAIIFIAMLDHGQTEPIAQGFAWLFFAAVLLRKDSILGALNKVGSKTTPSKKAN